MRGDGRGREPSVTETRVYGSQLSYAVMLMASSILGLRRWARQGKIKLHAVPLPYFTWQPEGDANEGEKYTTVLSFCISSSRLLGYVLALSKRL